MAIKVFLAGFANAAPDICALAYFKDSVGSVTGITQIPMAQPAVTDTKDDVRAKAETGLDDFVTNNSLPTPDSVEWLV